MQYDKKITISTSGSRFGPWVPQTIFLSEFYTKLSIPIRGTELRASYLSLPKKRQDELKDVGGFVGGELASKERKSGQVKGRDLITLDIDKVVAGGTQDILRRLDGLGCAYVCYSTRKHGAESPRMRAIFPIDRTVTTDEYEALARMAAKYLDPSMQMFDRTTFQPERLMYYPSCSSDSEYVFTYGDKPFLCADGVLGSYKDWRNFQEYPLCPDEIDLVRKTAEKQQDPTTKEGVIGAFCRVYNVYDVMEKFIPGAYEPVSGNDSRFTYVGGSTAGGAIIYQDGTFLYSNHATDPASGKLCNAFDLVRLHLFGDEDVDAKQGTPAHKLPSFLAVCKLIQTDASVYEQLQTDVEERIQSDFADMIQQPEPDTSVAQPLALPGAQPEKAHKELEFKVELSQDGSPRTTLDNAWALLETDPVLKGKIVLDVFQGKGLAIGPYPWNADTSTRLWTDIDDIGVQWYLEKYRDFRSKMDVLGALALCGNHHSVDPVKNYLDSLVWDNVPRLDMLFIDYLGAEDNTYTRAVTRKAFVAGVARTYEPGCKFDCMTVLAGPQGLGKSTLLRKMGKSWFSDNLQEFGGKDAKELIQGVWIVEIGELGYMNKTETNQVKQFLSQREDQYRAAYGRNTQTKPRRCVFFGTTNEDDYLKDTTGNRRFWPVDINKQMPRLDVFSALTEDVVDQLWAEAVVRYRLGEDIFLSKELETMAYAVQEEHRQVDAKEGLIHAYMEELVPVDYYNWTEDQQRSWDNGMLKVGGQKFELEKRKLVCAAEIWEKVMHSDLKFMNQQESRAINVILKNVKGWEPRRSTFGKYGSQRGFKRTNFL